MTQPLSKKLWKSFIIFGIIMVLMLWLFQIVFLNSFYEIFKKRELRKIGNDVIRYFGTEEFETKVYEESLKKGVAIRILDSNGTVVYPLNYLDLISPPRLSDGEYKDLVERTLEDPSKMVFYEQHLEQLNLTKLICAQPLKGGDNLYYLYMTTVLEPIDATTNVLQNQLLIISVVIILLSLVISYFISKKIANPISELTDSAKQLSLGDYNVEFDSEGFVEVRELSEYLNMAKSEMINAINMRSDLLANVSHDLKTPITVIKSYAEMIRDITGKDDQQREEDLNIIIDEANHLTDLIDEILDLTRTEASLRNLKLIPINMEQLSLEIIEKYNHLYKTKNQVTVKVSGEPYLLADYDKMVQVIYNLIGNALAYSTEDDDVKVEITNDGKHFIYQVKDTGQGIIDTDKDKIWTQYYRSSKNHKRTGKGSGLGLYIVQNVLEAHGFEYGVKDNKPRGSVFYFVSQL